MKEKPFTCCSLKSQTVKRRSEEYSISVQEESSEGNKEGNIKEGASQRLEYEAKYGVEQSPYEALSTSLSI